MNKGINLNHLDTRISPGDDFYMYVNGGWMRNTEIPADRSSWGSFHELARDTDHKVLTLLDEELQRPGAAENKAARLFESGMNIQQIERARLEAITPLLGKIRGYQDFSQLFNLLGQLIARGFGALLSFGIHPDLGDSKIYAAYLEPGSLGLPERDFYLDQDEKATHIRAEYQQYIADILTKEANYNSESARHIAEHILSLEQELAAQMMSKEDRRQLDKLYNPYTSEEVYKLYPSLDWDAFFKGMGINEPKRLIVTDPKYIHYLDTYLPTLSDETLKHYLIFMTINRAAPFVHSSLENMHFNLFSKTLEGIEVMRPRRERLVKVVNNYLGEALGQLFVARHFPANAKYTALEMAGDIIEAFKSRIKNLRWMSDSTKEYALEKLSAFKIKIGYPEEWKNYDELHLSTAEAESSYLADLMAVAVWKFKKDANRIGNEVDREEWFMAPQVVNAYYNPMFNEIVFPAAILQPPFFDWQADAAVNYGGIGAVIGHEITHGFDDQGSRFDKDGNLNEWWSAADRERFKELTTQLIRQFDAYFPFEDLPLNGTFTLGENIADLGGLSVAYDALQLYYKRHGKPGPIDGLTADQRFFMSWATVWRTKTRPEAMRTQIKTDPHPPGMYRAVAAPSNLESFYNAFAISPNSPWYRSKEERIEIW